MVVGSLVAAMLGGGIWASGVLAVPTCFVDGDPSDPDAPHIVAVTPADDSFSAASPPAVHVQFDRSLDVVDSTIHVLDNTGNQLEGTIAFTTAVQPDDTIAFNATDTYLEQASPYDLVTTVTSAAPGGTDCQSVTQFSIDQTPPTATIDTPIAGDDRVGSAEAATVQVTGTADDGAGSGIGSVDVVAAGVSSGSPVTLTATDAGGGATWSVTFDLTGFDDPSTVTFTALPIDVVGNTSTGPDASVSLDFTAPDAPTALTANPGAGGDVDLTWTPSASSDVATQIVHRDPVDVIDFGDNTTASHIDNPGADGTYDYTIIAVDGHGNESSSAVVSVLSDATGPLATIDAPIAGDDVVNAGEAPTVTITGTVDDGTGTGAAQVDVTVTDSVGGSVSGVAVLAAGTWSITLDLSGLDDGALTIDVEARDDVGNTDTAGASATLDTTDPSFVGSTPVDGSIAQPSAVRFVFDEALDGSGNIVVQNKHGHTLAGVVSFATTTVPDDTIVFTPSTAFTTAGSTYTATATVRDAAGNPTGVPITKVITFDVDAEAPTIDSLTVSDTTISPNGDGTLDTTTIDATFSEPVDWTLTIGAGPTRTYTGTGTTLTEVFDGTDNTATPLPDGTHGAVLTIQDPAGNTDTSSIDITIDTITNLAITSVTDPIGGTAGTHADLHGTAEPHATLSITATDGTTTTPPATTTANPAGTWTITGLDTASLNDGTLTFEAQATDAVANTNTDTTNALKDTVAEVAISSATDPIAAATANAATADGTTETGISNIDIEVTDGTNTSPPVTTPVDPAGNWTATGIDATSLTDGPITYHATATDTLGNTTTATLAAVKDTTAPVIDSASATPPVISPNGDGTLDTTTIDATISEAADWTVSFGSRVLGTGTGTAVSAAWDGRNAAGVRVADGAHQMTIAAVDAAGNATPALSVEVGVDTTVNVSLNSVTDPVNAADARNVAASGTADPGSSVAVTGRRAGTTTPAVTVTASPSGQWSTNRLDVSALQDGEVMIRATATDTVGNRASSSRATTKDATPPAVTVTTATDPVNASNDDAAQVAGTTEPGSSVAVTVRDGLGATATGNAPADASGRFTAAINTSSLADGAISYRVVATDTAGNVGPVQRVQATKDTVAPAITLDAAPDVNAANASAVNTGGTAEPGSAVAITISDGTGGTTAASATPDATGAWSATLNTTGLADGPLGYEATATDAAGNASTATAAAVKDATPPAVSVDTVTNPITAANAAATSAGGTTEPGATVTVVAAGGGASTAPAAATVEPDGSWSAESIDVSSLPDGTVTYTATATDGAGNTAVATKSAVLDRAGPTVQIDKPETLSSSRLGTVPVVFRGSAQDTVSGVAQVTATLTHKLSATTTFTATTAYDAATGRWTATFTGLLPPGQYTLAVSAADATGNAGQPATVDVLVL